MEKKELKELESFGLSNRDTRSKCSQDYALSKMMREEIEAVIQEELKYGREIYTEILKDSEKENQNRTIDINV